ncbi:MAG TPA: nitroreductase [Desulfobacteraceae bacterium]|nr:nitroreductase family protein [Deltaproteobacteria bacterium]MBW2355736.1 nitroreductase family protein [Deltaproteobacteria bacterium]RLB93683.1 MAG: nitroreductase [Deltaproteobacteria bacterium]HDI59815.1 nitroreductase [Desulfobacteraceae bacterium]
MSEFFQVIEQRRSIRKYEDRDVPEELVNRILEAVRWSPSWTNCQCWEVVVVRDAATKEKLQETIAPKNPATKAIVAAPVVLALCGRLGVSGYYDNKPSTKFGDWYLFDLGIATQSLCLAAHALGLGTVIVGLFDHDGAKSVLNVPQGVELVALIPLGYPAKSPSPPKRREIAEFTHRETY